MRLYELSQAMKTVIDGGYVFDEETGEVIFDETNLDQLEMELNDKIEGCGLYIKNLQAESDAIKVEMNKLKERKDRLDKQSERMRNYVLKYMRTLEKLSTPRIAISTMKSSRVEVTDADKLPDDLKRTVTEIKPDKNAIKKRLKNGETVNGAELIESTNLVIK